MTPPPGGEAPRVGTPCQDHPPWSMAPHAAFTNTKPGSGRYSRSYDTNSWSSSDGSNADRLRRSSASNGRPRRGTGTMRSDDRQTSRHDAKTLCSKRSRGDSRRSGRRNCDRRNACGARRNATDKQITRGCAGTLRNEGEGSNRRRHARGTCGNSSKRRHRSGNERRSSRVGAARDRGAAGPAHMPRQTSSHARARQRDLGARKVPARLRPRAHRDPRARGGRQHR